MAVGGVAVFPSDTVYGLACDAQNRQSPSSACTRLKRRALDKPSAVMFFELELALSALPELGARTRSALARLLPGAVTVLLPNPGGRFPLACGEDPATLGAAGAGGAGAERGALAGAAVERQPGRRSRGAAPGRGARARSAARPTC